MRYELCSSTIRYSFMQITLCFTIVFVHTLQLTNINVNKLTNEGTGAAVPVNDSLN